MGHRVEIMHYRDPDSACHFTVLLDGEPVDVQSRHVTIVSVDPGAGHYLSDWENARDEEIAEGVERGYTDAFMSVIAQAYDQGAQSEYVEEG